MLSGKVGEIMDGILLINKPINMTSHDVVGKVRYLLKTKKVGHAGTLDPLATGVLVLGINRGTKLLQFLTADSKQYRATLKLGISTTTYDREGEITQQVTFANDVSLSQVKEALVSFLGDSMQIPPIYSALKKNGKAYYEYAREGLELEIEPRPIHISKIELVSFENDTIIFDVEASKGTYVRSLCVDLAKKLGYPGHMTDLVRERSGEFELSSCFNLEDVQNGNFKLMSLEEAMKSYPSIVIDDENIVYHGKKIKSDIDHQVAVYSTDGKLLAVYGPDGKGYLKSVRGLFS